MFELLSQEGILNPATIDVIWTMSMVGLLLGVSTLTAWLLPWSNQEVMAVHNTVRTASLTLIKTTAPADTTRTTVQELIPARRVAAQR